MNSHFNLAKVVIPIFINKKFTYFIPENMRFLVKVGCRVLIPFGLYDIVGYVIKLKNSNNISKFKNIIEVLDSMPLFNPKMVSLFEWISEYYLYPLGKVIALALPSGLGFNYVLECSILPEGERVLKEGTSLMKIEEKILSLLVEKSRTVKHIEKAIKKPRIFLKKVKQKKWIKITNHVNFNKMKIKTVKYVSALITSKDYEGTSIQRKKILKHLELKGCLKLKELIVNVKTTSSLIKKMKDMGEVKIYNKPYYKKFELIKDKGNIKIKLTQEQRKAVDIVSGSIGKEFKVFLLAGVTGSGKTEIYIRLAKIALSLGLSVLILVPEIILVSQLEKKIKINFGNCMAVLHSGLSKLELHTQWSKILEKKATIVIGARSCVFAPIDKIGLVIIDEEHDSSYKQEKVPFYNAKDVGIMRAKKCDAVVVLGSATPSVQSWFNTEQGKFKKILLTNRIGNKPLPKVEVVDLSLNRIFRGFRRYFSSRLIDEININLRKGNQTLLFLNRRGFASFSICSKCGKLVKCKKCDISLTLHVKNNLLICHYCGFSKPYNNFCSFCNSYSMIFSGIGTERLEFLVKKTFPKAKVIRVDKDTVKGEKVIKKLLKNVKNREVDIIIGTQLITKGHNFPGITLVGIICADLSMNFPDFRSTERTFQLLSQVAGRAGRGEYLGKVILQTYNPKHFTILAAKKQNFRNFYSTEIKFREMLYYPPFCRMALIKIFGKNKTKVAESSNDIYNFCNNILRANKFFYDGLVILGPIKAPLSKIDMFYRWQILIKSPNVGKLHKLIKHLYLSKGMKLNGSVKLLIDVDPVSVM